MKHGIKSITGKVIMPEEYDSIKDAVEDAVKKGVNLEGAFLGGADLSGADLFRANLSRADLSRANLLLTFLSGADLSGAYLSGANLSGANLRLTCLSGADLPFANLEGSILEGTNLKEAYLGRAKNIISIGPIGNNCRIIYAVKHDNCIMIQAGCFWGNLLEFSYAVNKKYPDNSDYHCCIKFLENWAKK